MFSKQQLSEETRAFVEEYVNVDKFFKLISRLKTSIFLESHVFPSYHFVCNEYYQAFHEYLRKKIEHKKFRNIKLEHVEYMKQIMKN